METIRVTPFRREVEMAKVVVLGAGMMGTAITIPLSDNRHDVRLVGTHLDTDVIEGILESRAHPKLRSPVPDAVSPYTIHQLSQAMQGVEFVILGVNSLGVVWAAEMLGSLLDASVPVISLTKGLAGDGEGLVLLPDVLRSALPVNAREGLRLCAVGGPSIAGELAARRHTSVVVTGPDRVLLEEIADLLRTPYYHIGISTDVIGVEVSVGLKNLYALGVGIVQGLLEKEGPVEGGDAMHNLAAAVFAQGLREMAYLVDHMGGERESVYGLPGAGDLYVTCQGGRNRRMGRLIGLGMRYGEAKSQHMPEDTVEGAELAFAIAPTVEAMMARKELRDTALPLLRALIDIVCRDAPVVFPWDDFFSPPLTPWEEGSTQKP